MTKLPEGKTRLDLVREGLADTLLKKRGRLIVSLDKLFEDSRNERRTFRNMEGLTDSVKAVGVIEPITVTPEGADAYRIVTGHRRYRAAKAAGLTQVEILTRLRAALPARLAVPDATAPPRRRRAGGLRLGDGLDADEGRVSDGPPGRPARPGPLAVPRPV